MHRLFLAFWVGVFAVVSVLPAFAGPSRFEGRWGLEYYQNSAGNLDIGEAFNLGYPEAFSRRVYLERRSGKWYAGFSKKPRSRCSKLSGRLMHCVVRKGEAYQEIWDGDQFAPEEVANCVPDEVVFFDAPSNNRLVKGKRYTVYYGARLFCDNGYWEVVGYRANLKAR